MSARIQLNDLTVVLGTGNRAVEALREINLTVEENEFLCVMGPSGCGKTTLLNVIAGFVPATSGTAMMNNARIAGPGKDRAVVFQSDAVFPWMTVEQNIAYSGRFTKASRKERKRAVATYLDLVGLRDNPLKYLLVQELVAQPRVEALDVAVLPGRAGLEERLASLRSCSGGAHSKRACELRASGR